jgi:hypothetical protein
MITPITWHKIGQALRESAMTAHDGALPPIGIAYSFLADNPECFGCGRLASGHAGRTPRCARTRVLRLAVGRCRMIRVHSKSGRFIALLHADLSASFSVVATADGVNSFASSWHCAHFGDGPVRFEYAANGDLVDMQAFGWDTERADGGAVLALCEDAQMFGQKCLDRQRARLTGVSQ